MGDRYPAMRAKVIGFRAVIRAITPRFKLGQDERPAVFDEIVASMHEPALGRWMRRFARARGAPNRTAVEQGSTPHRRFEKGRGGRLNNVITTAKMRGKGTGLA